MGWACPGAVHTGLAGSVFRGLCITGWSGLTCGRSLNRVNGVFICRVGK